MKFPNEFRLNFEKCIGSGLGKRHLVTNKEFKPLKDLLALTDCPITNCLYEEIHSGEKPEQFVMSPDMALEVERLTHYLIKNPDKIDNLLPKVRPPFRKVCVEMPLTKEVDAMRDQTIDEHKAKVYRTGAYIECKELPDETMLISFSPYYEFCTGYVISSTVTLYYNDNKVIPGYAPVDYADNRMIWSANFSESFFKAAEGHTTIDEMERMVKENQEMVAMILHEAAEELPNLYVAWLVLLNSKSGVTKTKIAEVMANPKLGKRERNRRSRSSYTIVSLSDTELVKDGVVTHKDVVGAHRVRGHFKAKKWGVFWWRPHIRGVGELKDRESYKLTA